MTICYAPIYVHPVPENHKFPMEKYALLKEQLLYEGIIEEENVLVPNPMDIELVKQIHHHNYLTDLLELKLTPRQQRVSGFVHSQELILRELTIMEGTRLAAERALVDGIGFNIAGGTHHAFSDRGEGFCLLNDQALAAQWLLNNKQAERILIIDLDVHQGNGTAEIFEKRPEVFTFSMHGKANYPLNKEHSDLDIELETNCSDHTYLEQLSTELPRILDSFQPDFLFYQCGVDVLASDKLGKLSLSLAGCKKRDEIVFHEAKLRCLPIVCSMGGGYSEELRIIVEAHTNTFRVAARFFS